MRLQPIVLLTARYCKGPFLGGPFQRAWAARFDEEHLREDAVDVPGRRIKCASDLSMVQCCGL
jgi:hypothetical protein